MKKTLFILVTLYFIGCNNKEQSLLTLIKEKDREIEKLEKKNSLIPEKFSRKNSELKTPTSREEFSRSKKPQKATLKDVTKILAYVWEIEPKEIFNIPIGNSYYEGSEDAKVTIIEWMDYQ